jgi:hypothetical protein
VIAALVIALIAAGLAIAAWFRPAPSATPRFSDQQTAQKADQAKKNLCSAYINVRKGVVINTHMADPIPNDEIGHIAVAANARLALLGGGAYLKDRIAAEPASPADLAQAVNNMGNTMEQLGIAYLAAATQQVLDPLRHDLDSQITQLNKMCS